MELQDLEDKLKILENEFEHRKTLIIKEYCDANNPYKIGDKFTDHIGTIMIEKIYYSFRMGPLSNPSCIYFGTELKKDGTPKKSGDKRRSMNQTILKNKNYELEKTIFDNLLDKR